MKKTTVILLGWIFRKIPHFRGKYRAGVFLQKLLLNGDGIGNASNTVIRLKNGARMIVDIRADTHKIPFWTGRYDQNVIAKLSSLFSHQWVVMDIGANIGYYTVPFAKKIKQLQGKLYAFEPIERNFNILSRIVQMNDLGETCEMFRIALGNEEGEIAMSFTEQSNSGNACLVKNELEKEGYVANERATITRMDNFYRSHHIERCDLIKIDIEGAEIFFVQGATEFLKKTLPVIYGEFNSYFLKQFGYSIVNVNDILVPLGYESFMETKPGTFKRCEIGEGMENILYIPKGKLTSQQLQHLLD